MSICIKQFDHWVLTVSDYDKTVAFYTHILGMLHKDNSLLFGNQKFNLHKKPGEFQPASQKPTSGSADFCLLCDGDIDAILATLQAKGVSTELGPVRRNGAQGAMDSIYLRDPDGNLVELAVLCNEDKNGKSS